MGKLRTSIATKQKLSSTLRSWLPILQSDIDSLQEAIEPFVKENPFLNVKSSNEKLDKKYQRKDFFKQAVSNSASETIEALTVNKKSLFEVLREQINPPLFPTPKSQNIAEAIIDHIDNEGYFDEIGYEEIEKQLGATYAQIESTRKRFANLEPIGVGALDFKESFLFQLGDVEVEEEVYLMATKMIKNFDEIEQMSKQEYFKDALKVIKKFRNPPGIDFLEEAMQVIPDIFIYDNSGSIEVRLNDAYYPEILIETEGHDDKSEFVSEKIKDAKDLVDALEMRKATLYKIGLMIVEYQYDFFFGGAIKPMKLKDLAGELDRNPSTISRAISSKYLSCSRGVIPLKQFFATALDEDVSNSAIKEYMRELVENEDRKKPLSDAKILSAIEEKFNIKMVRRTITKYRQEFNIAGSSERKKLYALKGF